MTTRHNWGRTRLVTALLKHLGLLVFVLFAGGLAAAALVRMAPGFGSDERMLNPLLSRTSIQALAGERAAESHIWTYYAGYLRGLLHGDLGASLSLGRPVKVLLAERMGVTLRVASGGLALAWGLALAAVVVLEIFSRRSVLGVWCDRASSTLAGSLLCLPVAVLAVGCFYLGGTPTLALAVILFPRVFRYMSSLVRQAAGASHVLTAHAMGEGVLRIVGFHIITPVLPELVALAGVSVSLTAGATIPVEALCDSPGVGQLVWEAALARDLPVVVNVTLLITALTAVANFLVDVFRIAWEA
jgi:peptide/nickel transport system permease protein